MKFVIDRIEGKVAVCQNIETKQMLEILLSDLPQNCREGMCFVQENGVYKIDSDLEEQRRERIEEKRKKLWKK